MRRRGPHLLQFFGFFFRATPGATGEGEHVHLITQMKNDESFLEQTREGFLSKRLNTRGKLQALEVDFAAEMLKMARNAVVRQSGIRLQEVDDPVLPEKRQNLQ